MKNTSTIIITGILFLALGILIGKYAFRGDNNNLNNHHVEESDDQWTCSMHPQVNLPEFGACPICGMDLIPMNRDGAKSNPLVFEMTDEAIKLANIQTTTVGKSSNSESEHLRLSGKIQADESKSASLVSHIPGRIEKLYVSFTGEYVRKGQKLARIYSPNLITAQKELLESKMMEKVNPKLFEATLNKLKYWKITDQQIENILESKEINESFDIYAEHSGVVNKKRVSVGDHLMEGGILFDIQNLDKLWVVFDIYENDLKDIALGDEIQFSTPAFPSKEFNGTISFVNPVINPHTRAASVRVEVQNKNQILKPEMFVTGLLFSNKSNVQKLTIPKSAVLWTGTRSVVYVKVANSSIPSFEFREISLGNAIGNNYQIVSGLSMGDEVVTKGAFVIDASAQLNNQASMMNRKVDGGEIKIILPDFTEESSAEFKKRIQRLILDYLKLKDNLVATNFEKTQENAQEILAKKALLGAHSLAGEAEKYWITKLQEITRNIVAISSANDIESQREHFDYLSLSIIETAQVFGVYEATFYIQHCPMVNDNEGASWLSDKVQIRNPYFGDLMLQCGTVEDTLIGFQE